MAVVFEVFCVWCADAALRYRAIYMYFSFKRKFALGLDGECALSGYPSPSKLSLFNLVFDALRTNATSPEIERRCKCRGFRGTVQCKFL